jgi:Domain of unknown function (DUF4386)
MSATATPMPAPAATAERSLREQHPRLRRLTKVAGVLYLVIFVVYPLATLVRSSLVVPGDATATVDNIRAQETLFRWGIAGEATIVLVEVVLAGVLYALLRPVSRSVSLAASLARVAEAVVMAAGCLVTSVFTLRVVADKGYLGAFDTDQRDALALFFQEANNDITLLWGFFFALSLLLTGWLVRRSGFLPRIPGILLMLAGLGYLVQSFGTFVAPGMADIWAVVVLVLAVPGELVFAIWLLAKGVDMDSWSAAAIRAQRAQV